MLASGPHYQSEAEADMHPPLPKKKKKKKQDTLQVEVLGTGFR